MLAGKGVKGVRGCGWMCRTGMPYTRWIESACKPARRPWIFLSPTPPGTARGLVGETGWKAMFEIDVMGARARCGDGTTLPCARSASGAVVLIGSISGVMSKMIPRARGLSSYGGGQGPHSLPTGAMLRQAGRQGRYPRSIPYHQARSTSKRRSLGPHPAEGTGGAGGWRRRIA